MRQSVTASSMHPMTRLSQRKEVRKMIISDAMLMMKNGQMLILRDREMIALNEDIILVDGTRVGLDGRVTMTDGSYQELLEGQAIMIDNRQTAS